MKKLITIFCAVLLFSCSYKNNQRVKSSLKDSLLKEFLVYEDSSDYNDAAEINYKVLKAYQYNDTSFFKDLLDDIERRKTKKRHQFVEDSCIHQQALKYLNAEEAYRFIYEDGFCKSKFNITIQKKSNNIDLHFIHYQFATDTLGCHILYECERKLTQANWNEVMRIFDSVDYWGLKYDNGKHWLDGDVLSIEGFLRGDSTFNRPEKSILVRRSNPEILLLYKAFALAVKLSAISEIPKGFKKQDKSWYLVGPCTWERVEHR